MSVAIGIDLGTTNTVVAAVVDGVAVTLEDENKRRLLPSVVSFHPSGTVLVGEPARERRLMDPRNTIFSVKPLLGRPWDSEEVQGSLKRFPFELAPGAKNSTTVMAREVAYALPEISAFVLRRAKAIAEAALGEPVERAVITVPANFNDLQRASTKIAGKLAGLEVMRILNEPTAAALAYGQSIAKAEKIAVFDLGGGTFDITLLDLTGNVFEVLATAGDTALGGDDIDRAVAHRLALDVLRRYNVDARTDALDAARLQFAAEELKKELSTQRVATRDVHELGGRQLNVQVTLTRDDLEAVAQPLIARTIDVAKQSIESVSLTPRDFDRVILVGGSTRMPLVARMVEQVFNQPPHLKVNPDEVVALGAAIQAHALNRTKRSAKRRSGHDQLASTQATPPNVPKAPPVPAKAAPPPLPKKPPPPAPAAPPANAPMPEFISFNKAPAVISFGSDLPAAKPGEPSAQVPRAPAVPRPVAEPPPRPPIPSIDFGVPPPQAAPALPTPPAFEPALPSSDGDRKSGSGDLSQLVLHSEDFFKDVEPTGPVLTQEQFDHGSAIATNTSTPLLIDVTPLSLGVETVGGYADILIPANSPVPCEKTRIFRTASDGQTSVSIRVAQGESSRFGENTRLGDLELSGLRSATRGEAKVAVTFELDADGILNVRAKDPDTGRETTATMRLLGTATAEDMGEMAARQAQHNVA